MIDFLARFLGYWFLAAAALFVGIGLLASIVDRLRAARRLPREVPDKIEPESHFPRFDTDQLRVFINGVEVPPTIVMNGDTVEASSVNRWESVAGHVESVDELIEATRRNV